MKKARRLSCLSAFLLIGLGSSLIHAAEIPSFAGHTMGTTYSVKVSSLPGSLDIETLQADVDRCLNTVNQQMSTWRNDSELSRFNQFKNTEWFAVSAETVEVVKTAITVSEQTNGAFDVTVGPLVNLWSFGPDPTDRKIPAKSKITEAKAQVGYRLLEVRDEPPALRKSRADVYVDLSAIAKGFGVDQVARLLERHGLKHFMVEIGGEVRTLGTKPDGEPWRIGIETPTPFARGLQKILGLSGWSLATSGDYRNFVVIDGKRYSHTINPHTGWPVDHQLTSVSVVADSCTLADAYATALMVLGPETGYNWATEQNVAALFIIQDGEQFLERPTPEFDRLFPTNPPTQAPSAVTTTWLIALGVFLLAVLLMSVGVIFSNRRIKGSCGGLAGLRDEQGRTRCDACNDPSPDCQGVKDPHASAPSSD